MSSYTSPFPTFTSAASGTESSFLSGSIQDLKSSLKVTLTSSSLPSGYVVSLARVSTDKASANTSAHFHDVTWHFNGEYAKFIIGSPTNATADVVYNFVSGTAYRIQFQITIQDTNVPAPLPGALPFIPPAPVMYQSNYTFNYVDPTPGLTDFTFNANIESSDPINIVGLNIDSAYKALYPNDIPTSITFQFNEQEYSSNNVNDELTEPYMPNLPYSPTGSYTLPSNELNNDNIYEIVAIANWGQEGKGYSTYVRASQDLFVLARPEIDNVVTYDAQNDGGNDGVGIGGVDTDSSTQVIATITLNPVDYENYLPSNVKFIFYDSNNNQVTFSIQTYNALSTNSQSYNITLDDVNNNLIDPAVPLLNGIPGYTVTAEVVIPVQIGSLNTTQTRISDPVSVVFKQGVAPILPLIIGNTWDLVSNSNPSSAATLYNSSPLLGVSGYFLKNAQFMSGYSRNLDNTATVFLLQYKLNGAPLVNVVSAALIQQGTEALEQTMINAMGSVVNSPNGQYANVVGPAGIVGTAQNPLVFYIPNVQGTVTFNESDVVNVVVTIIDTDNEFVDSPATVSNTSSPVTTVNGVIMVNKIPTYSYTSAQQGQTVEPYISNVDVANTVLSVLSNNVLSQVNKTQVIADSAASMITQSPQGWTVVNPAAVMSGNPPQLKFPKVNLYYYAATSSYSNSFTRSQINQTSSLGMWYVIYQNGGATYPFLTAYTQPTGSGDAFPGFYKSKLFYAPPEPSITPTKNGFNLLYTGVDDGSYPEIPAGRRIKLTLSLLYSDPTSLNPGIDNENIGAIAIQTSSNVNEVRTGDYNFTLLYAGVITDNSYTTTLFTDPIHNINIPVDNAFSIYFNNSIIDNVGAPYGNVDILNTTPVSSYTLPNLTENTYTVQYSIQNPNNNNAVVKGLVSALTTISTLNQPLVTDFTVSNFSFNTFNNNQKSSIVFDLAFNPYVLNNIDGVHVYFTSDLNSNIALTQIGTFKTTQNGLEIFLLSGPESNVLGSGANPVLNNLAPLLNGGNLLWNDYTSATITFVPFRDNRVDSAIVETENLFATWTAPTVWNIPVIDKPSVSGDILLTGGVVNSDSDTVLNWTFDTGSNTSVTYPYPVAFSYTLTMTEGSSSPVPCTVNVLGGTASAELDIDLDNDDIDTYSYVLTLKKVFQGQSSLADTITFNSVVVDTSDMDVSISDPSNTNSVTVSWVDPIFTGTGSSSANNVVSLYLTNNGVPMKVVNDDTIEVSGGSYDILPWIGYIYQFCLSVTACVPYSVNGGSLVDSSAVPLALGPITAYTVSTIPNVALVPYTALGSDSSTVLIQNTTTPSLLLNLNAMGLETEGFISLVVVLTQDGTADKPGGCEVLLQFPQNPTSSNPFLFPNVVGAAGSGNNNLVGGESSLASPLNLVPTGLSTNVGQYTLTIGSVIPDNANTTIGRYGYSSLTFPANSGFVNGEDSNIMAILTTRRGTDVMVGTFNFAAPPVASNVSVNNVNGQYILTFTLS